MEEKQYLRKTNQDLHEKVHCTLSFFQTSLFCNVEMTNTVGDGAFFCVKENLQVWSTSIR